KIPVLAVTDLYYLDYYQTKTHFSLHGVVLVGFDEERGVCFTADTDREGIQETSLDSLAKAMASREGAVPLDNQWLAVERIPNADLGQAARRAVAYNARRMLEPPSDWTGLVALERFAARLHEWNRLEDWKWAARFGYQVIERRGTGGGAFRKMYAQFLREAETDLDIREFQKLRAGEEMEHIAQKWTELAGELKKISEGERADFSTAAGIAQDLARRERAFFEVLREASASWNV
ncbi:MAG: DUF4872 domain-containing protein, partial [Alicyclobacillaceae bacterium]|nr:DUF4872 domain-containing protein [Alicyclobacillaceae bacterium]